MKPKAVIRARPPGLDRGPVLDVSIKTSTKWLRSMRCLGYPDFDIAAARTQLAKLREEIADWDGVEGRRIEAAYIADVYGDNRWAEEAFAQPDQYERERREWAGWVSALAAAKLRELVARAERLLLGLDVPPLVDDEQEDQENSRPSRAHSHPDDRAPPGRLEVKSEPRRAQAPPALRGRAAA